MYKSEWLNLLENLQNQIKTEMYEYNNKCKNFTPNDKLEYLNLIYEYNLRPYQAIDLITLKNKISFNNYNAGLILSEPRTGKSRIAISYILDFYKTTNESKLEYSNLIICPKIAIQSWCNEINEIAKYRNEKININILESTNEISKLEYENNLTFNLISYELFKRLTKSQFKTLIRFKLSKYLILIVDELHRLRNFKTQQSEAIFNFKNFLIKNYDKDNFHILGITGTPAVKNSYDVFGILSFINFSYIGFRPYEKDFNQFKEYFYNCEDTSFGKKIKSIKRKDELNYILGLTAIQTCQKDLNLFKNYTKKYKKIELKMDSKQNEYYEQINEYMECENIDCKNNLTKYIRLQQICNDPSGLFPSYGLCAPKIKFILNFIKNNQSMKILIISKSVLMLDSLSKQLSKNNIRYTYINGTKDNTLRLNEINNFKNDINVMLLQLDTCKESLTLPEATCTIFTDRSFIQGFNEQAEARMTPVDGKASTKYIFDLIMKDTIEEKIYKILVYRKQNINDVNVLFQN